MRSNCQIWSTQFNHRRIHLVTWKPPNGLTVNQIDLAMVATCHASSTIDVSSCRGSKCDSDYYLVKVVVRERPTKDK